MLKRFFDAVVAATALLVLSPLLLAIAVLLRFTGEGEIFYRQERVGRGGKRFRIYKFATMLKDSPNLSGGDITIDRDPRILPHGRFLRKTKINELPQLLNVVAGDMSIIGPRPLTPRVAALFPPRYWEDIAELRPGLSGVGSIVFRDEESLLSAAANRERVYADSVVPYKMALEGWYLRNRSFVLDLKLIALTLFAMLYRDLDVRRFLRGMPALAE
jgi:lipopolysaccharide/colanic/teichoic acid biosynthesis glycosyltransferase